MEPWLIVGLGNPGPQYELTPHNIGFLTIDRLAASNGGIRVNRPDGHSLAGVGQISGSPVLLAKPQTFMNLSGPAVKALLAKHSVELSRLVVIYDDLDLPWTGLRIRPGGSAGSHKGMLSIVGSLGANEFPRVRLGVETGRPDRNGADFVLSPFRKTQMKELDELLDYASRAVESIIADGVEKAMARFNRRSATVPDEPGKQESPRRAGGLHEEDK